MPDQGPWENIRKELASPWDWVAAGIGAAGGLVVSGVFHFTDAGTSIGAGAVLGATARKSLANGMRGRLLDRRALRLQEFMRKYLRETILPSDAQQEILAELLTELETDRELFRAKIMPSEQFEMHLDEYLEKFRNIASS